MGANFAYELSEIDNLTIAEQVQMHLTYNFYPPVPASMLQPCLDAIASYWEMDYDREIDLQGAAQWRGNSFAPASAIVEQHRLWPWSDIVPPEDVEL